MLQLYKKVVITFDQLSLVFTFIAQNVCMIVPRVPQVLDPGH